MMLRLFEVQAPVGDAPAIAAFETELLDLYGGFSARDISGVWRDPSGAVYNAYDEPMRAYQIAVGGEPELASLVFAHFPAERAVYVAEIGSAQIVERGRLQAPFAANAA